MNEKLAVAPYGRFLRRTLKQKQEDSSPVPHLNLLSTTGTSMGGPADRRSANFTILHYRKQVYEDFFRSATHSQRPGVLFSLSK